MPTLNRPGATPRATAARPRVSVPPQGRRRLQASRSPSPGFRRPRSGRDRRARRSSAAPYQRCPQEPGGNAPSNGSDNTGPVDHGLLDGHLRRPIGDLARGCEDLECRRLLGLDSAIEGDRDLVARDWCRRFQVDHRESERQEREQPGHCPTTETGRYAAPTSRTQFRDPWKAIRTASRPGRYFSMRPATALRDGGGVGNSSTRVSQRGRSSLSYEAATAVPCTWQTPRSPRWRPGWPRTRRCSSPIGRRRECN